MQKFPNQNPNPVLRVDIDGTMNYFNEASEYIIKNIDADIGRKLPKEFLNNILTNEKKFELDVGSKTYVFNYKPINNLQTQRKYSQTIRGQGNKNKL